MEKRKTYSELLRSPLWQKKRLEIFERDNYTCQYCGSTTKELHVHHKTYKKGANPWEYDNDDLISLCHDCHEYETNDKKDLYLIFKNICALSRKCGFSEQFLCSLLSNIQDELGRLVDGEPINNLHGSIIESTFYGTQILHDGKILYDYGIISSDEKMNNIHKNMPMFYSKFIEMYGNKDNK